MICLLLIVLYFCCGGVLYEIMRLGRKVLEEESVLPWWYTPVALFLWPWIVYVTWFKKED